MDLFWHILCYEISSKVVVKFSVWKKNVIDGGQVPHSTFLGLRIGLKFGKWKARFLSSKFGGWQFLADLY